MGEQLPFLVHKFVHNSCKTIGIKIWKRPFADRIFKLHLMRTINLLGGFVKCTNRFFDILVLAAQPFTSYNAGVRRVLIPGNQKSSSLNTAWTGALIKG
ncbi:hypothetical protein [Niabella hirudinis]|uniref:hypothetical protein n=1 Tax=Niabella hirudinis TaxID=1285929 RepID=UPI003EB844D3